LRWRSFLVEIRERVPRVLAAPLSHPTADPLVGSAALAWRYHGRVEFDWDDAKAASNLAKHGVSFEEALTVFDDPLAAIFEDEGHSTGEDREIIIGHS